MNKIENGRLWYVVKKPHELVVHEGDLDDGHTISWSRNEREPLKIEYFRETVLGDTYSIVGYGHYEMDDPNLLPRTWFHG